MKGAALDQAVLCFFCPKKAETETVEKITINGYNEKESKG